MCHYLRDDLYTKTLAESVTTPPLLIVFYKRHSNIDPMWHVRHLGEFCRGPSASGVQDDLTQYFSVSSQESD